MRLAVLSLVILLQSVNPLSKPKSLFNYKSLHPVDMAKYAALPAKQEIIDSWFGKGYRSVQLTGADFVEIDNALIKAVKEHNDRKEYGFVYNTDTYYKQVIAVINKKGEKEVYLNCFCAGRYVKEWREQLEMVNDGGNCYFQVRINLKTKKIVSFSVNGEA